MGEMELCCQCESPTGRAGRYDDSLYFGNHGPYCEDCSEHMTDPEMVGKLLDIDAKHVRLRTVAGELAGALEEMVTHCASCGGDGRVNGADIKCPECSRGRAALAKWRQEQDR